MAIPELMQAAQIVEFKKPYKIHSIPTPTDLEPWQMLVRIAVASFCHTDIMVSEGIFSVPLPVTASHEGTGTVVSTGSDVEDFKLGDRVLVGMIYQRCYNCVDCKGSETQYCVNGKRNHGATVDGSFAEYQVVDAREASVLPDNLSFLSAAPLACAGITVYAGLKRLGLKPDQWVAIIGAGGGLGHLAVQMAKAMKLQVIAVDARDEGLQLAKECGADVLVDVRESPQSVKSKVMSATGTIAGADGTLNVSDANSAAATACSVTKMHGTVVQIAQPHQFTIPFTELIFRDIRIVGSLISNKQGMEEMLKLVAENHIKVKTNAFKGLKELNKLVEFAHTGKMAGKAVVIIDQDAVEKEKTSGLKMNGRGAQRL